MQGPSQSNTWRSSVRRTGHNCRFRKSHESAYPTPHAANAPVCPWFPPMGERLLIAASLNEPVASGRVHIGSATIASRFRSETVADPTRAGGDPPGTQIKDIPCYSCGYSMLRTYSPGRGFGHGDSNAYQQDDRSAGDDGHVRRACGDVRAKAGWRAVRWHYSGSFGVPCRLACNSGNS